jgi:chitinase
VHLGVDPAKHSEILTKRGEDTYPAYLPNGITLIIIAVIFPAISRLYQVPNEEQVLREQFRLIPGYCLGPAIQEAPVPPGPDPPGLNGFQTEHPLDVSAPTHLRYIQTLIR